MKLLIVCLAVGSLLPAAPPLSEPSLSPDHTEIAFISGGDIWTVPAAGGNARLLISHPATESSPLYSPDGTRLAFVSTRTGDGDIYVLTFGSGELKRITFDDTRASLDAWSPDGKWLYFTSTRGDVGNMGDLYRVAASGGTPVAIAAERYTDESQAAPNPARDSIGFVSGRMAVNQWWRNGHAHIDETRIAAVTPAAASGQPQYKTLLENHAKNLWPMWSPDGKQLYFMSDASGTENLWRMRIGSAPQQMTHFTNGRVLFPHISQDGKAIVFERDFGIWKFDVASGSAKAVEIALRGLPAGPSTTHLSLTSEFRDLALSPDGKKVAFVAHGEVFAASAKDGGNAIRLTQTPANENAIAWAPDSRKLVYVSDRGGVKHLYLYDLAKETETALTSGAVDDGLPVWSPDGRQIAYAREGRELHVVEVETKKDRTLVNKIHRIIDNNDDQPLAWSPDGQWLAFFVDDVRGFRNVSVVPAAGGQEQRISFLANSFGDQIVWSPDRTYLLFNSGQRTEQNVIARVDLIPQTPKFREDQFRNLFRDELPRTNPPARPTPPGVVPAASPGAAADAGTGQSTPAGLVDADSKKARKPVEIMVDGIRRRLSVLPVGMDAVSQVISPDGKVLLFIGGSGNSQNLYTYSLDEFATQAPVARQLTASSGRKERPQFSPDGKEVYYLDAGRINVVPIETRITRPLAITAELDVNFDQEKKEVFEQAWSSINETFFDPKFHGVNWAEARASYGRWVEGARTPDEVRRVISLMIGELNASHLGISPGGGPQAVPSTTGRLGLTIEPATGTITSVVSLGPADVAGIKTGEKLLAVDGVEIHPDTNLDELLQYKTGKRTVLRTSAKQEVALLPVNRTTGKKLLYRQWVEERRAYVQKISKGRLGYVHVVDMSSDALNQLYADLDTGNQGSEGVVIDLRNNNGGFVNAYALDIFARRPYLTMTTRGSEPTPARAALGQRSLELPTVLVVNQNSLSDAEDFTEGYRTLHVGKVVGVPTAGWIIYTGGTQLIDGSVMRQPRTRVTAHDGSDMELHPRPVDVTVELHNGDTYAGADAQLDAAVKTLLGEIGNRGAEAR